MTRLHGTHRTPRVGLGCKVRLSVSVDSMEWRKNRNWPGAAACVVCRQCCRRWVDRRSKTTVKRRCVAQLLEAGTTSSTTRNGQRDSRRRVLTTPASSVLLSARGARLESTRMLGLTDYDSAGASSDASPAVGATEAGAAAAQPPVQEKPTGLLAIVDYGAEEDEPEKPVKPLGFSLDDDAVAKAAPRKVGGVQISVVRKTPPRPDDSAPESSQEPRGDASAVQGTPRPAFVTPDSPPGEVPAKLMDKFRNFVASSQEGNFVNDHIRHTKRFRNPDLLEKLVNYMDVKEFGTNYPPDLYDPGACRATGAQPHPRATRSLAHALRPPAWRLWMSCA